MGSAMWACVRFSAFDAMGAGLTSPVLEAGRGEGEEWLEAVAGSRAPSRARYLSSLFWRSIGFVVKAALNPLDGVARVLRPRRLERGERRT